MMRTLILCLVAVATVSAVQAKEGVRADEAVVVKGLSFFRHFGQTHRNRRELNQVLECDYDHPEKSGHCPPVHHIQPFPEVEVEGDERGQLHMLAPQKVLAEQSE